VIPGDIGAQLARVLRAAIGAGELPPAAAASAVSGSWRPAPAEAGGGPGVYATSLPFALAGLTGMRPAPLAGLLASRLGVVPWISSARVTGGGYLTVTVTAGHLIGLAARIIAAGPACAGCDALAGTSGSAPSMPDLAAAPGWNQAWRSQRDALAGRLARAAGATVNFLPAIRMARPEPATPAGSSPVPVAVAYYGADAVRYALARTATGQARAIERQLSVPLDLANPFFAVRYAHADAASTRRWAADLGLAAARSADPPARWSPVERGGCPAARPAGLSAAAFGGSESGRPPAEPGPTAAAIAFPPEFRLLDLLSWLPERVAAAARRARPAELTAYLECLAGAWLDCRATCPALPFRGAAAPPDQAGTAARLLLADAAREALAAGLGLLGVSAPARI